jgi:ribose transport system ATP-binding protein
MTPALTVTNMSKTFGGQRALENVSLSVAPGEIRALVGQNGCGKSTLIKILAGFHQPDDGGSAEVDGQPLTLGNGPASEAAGLRFVHQDLGLVGSLDAVDNLAMGVGYRSFHGVIKWSAERERAKQALDALGYDIDVRAPVASLAMSERTAVAIARALSTTGSDAKLLILDEPTANLPTAEAERLYQLIHRVAKNGLAVLFVSHHFDEVFELADNVTVLRDGRHIITRPVEGLDEPGLIELVIGRTLEEFHHDAAVAERGELVLDVKGLEGPLIHDLSLQIHATEIVGIAGITGSGREDLAAMIFGGKSREGDVTLTGVRVPRSRPDVAMDMGIGLVPAERHANAAFMASSLRENITLVDPSRHMRGMFLRQRTERSDVFAWLEKLDVKPCNTEFPMAALSGGNQQKVVLARWLRKEPKVLILDEPTQGVDVGAKADIHGMVNEVATQGAGVLILSTDHEELVRLCHRVIVLRNGVIVAELSGSRIQSDAITAATIGRKRAAVA